MPSTDDTQEVAWSLGGEHIKMRPLSFTRVPRGHSNTKSASRCSTGYQLPIFLASRETTSG